MITYLRLRWKIPATICALLILCAASLARDKVVPSAFQSSLSAGNSIIQGIDQSLYNENDAPYDTLYLEEIIIRSTRIREPLHYQPVDVQRIDSTKLSHFHNRSVSEVLSRYSGLFIRDNGPGGQATLSQRGLAASQTRVLWEGFPIHSISLGLADLSLIPAGLFRSVEVSPGTPSSAFGGGSLGGTVWLSSQPSMQENLVELRQSAGAFGTRNSHVNAGMQSDDWSVSLRGGYRAAQNDFRYFNRATGRYESRNHNAGRAGHLMGNAGYRFSGGRFYTGIWYLDSEEEIPGSILSGNTRAVQTNQALRWIAGLETNPGSWNLNLRTFLENDRFRYEDPPTDIDSRFRLERRLVQLDLVRPSTGSFVWQAGLSGGIETVYTDNYPDVRQRRMFSIRLSPEIRYETRRLRFSPAARIDHYTGFGLVLSPSLGINRELIEERLFLKGMISRDFNPPSFNDLYWAPGGNPDLKPERSFRIEGGFIYKPGFPLVENLRLTAYRINLEQGIYWLPGSGGIWSPANIEKIHARGAEAGLDLEHHFGAFSFHWGTGLDRRRSVIGKERFPGDNAAGNQMRYVPEWILRSHLNITTSGLSLIINYRWTGERYVTEDQSSSLDPFRVLDLTTVLNRTIRGMDLNLQLAVFNVLDENYEIIRWYPMPGRHFEISLSAGIPF